MTNECSSQESFETLLQTGKIVKNYPSFPELDLAKIVRLSFNKKLTGNVDWHHNYNYPELTLQATLGDLGNKDVLGSIAGLTAGFRFAKVLNQKWSLTAEACFGAAYFNKPYDEFNNGENITIGSKITAQATADFGALYKFHPRWSLIARASILHCSNSHVQLPNVGINLPMISLGIRYSAAETSVIPFTGEQVVDKRPKFNLRFALGINEQGGATGPVNGPKYSVLLASAYIYRHYSPVARWQMGLEGYYNNGTYAFITSHRYYSEKERLKSSSLLYILGHEYIFGNVGVVTQGGLYLYNPFAHDRYDDMEANVRDFLKTWFTARLGFQYYLLNTYVHKHHNLFAGWYVKTNFGKADFMEMSLGYNF